MPKDPKHHYIPVFYLQQWADARSCLIEFSRQGPYGVVKPRHTSPTGTGYVRGLYCIDDIDPYVVNAVESLFLKPSDGLAAEALQCFLVERAFPKPGPMRTSWSRFMLSLMIRYPKAVAHMKKQLRENVEKMYEQTRTLDQPATFAEFEAKLNTHDMARVHGKLLMDLMQDSRMGRLIFGMHWGVMKYKNYRHNLLTSDRAIASNIFPISAHHMCLPISPEMVFVACATQQAEEEFMRLDPHAVMQAMNNTVVRQAQTYVWGTDDSQLRYVKNRLGKGSGPMGAYLV
jgi:Protein of unknown function (DUF4238)